MWGLRFLLALTNITSHKGEQIFTLTSLYCSQNSTVSIQKPRLLQKITKEMRKHLFVGLSLVGCDSMLSLSLQVLARLVIKSGEFGILQTLFCFLEQRTKA